MGNPKCLKLRRSIQYLLWDHRFVPVTEHRKLGWHRHWMEAKQKSPVGLLVSSMSVIVRSRTLEQWKFRKPRTNDSFSWKASTTRRRHTKYLPQSTTRRATRFQPKKNQEDPQILPIRTNDPEKF